MKFQTLLSKLTSGVMSTMMILASFSAMSQTNVFDDVISTSSNHTYLTAALQQEGLDAALQSNMATLTVFAPDDDAFLDLAAELNTDIAGLLALPNLSDILTYHVLGQVVASSAITNGAIETPLNNANTVKLTVTSMSEVFVNQAEVNGADLNADNGTVHSIDAVLLPSETVADVAIDNGFSTLVTAVVTAELLPALTDPFADWTVFAPSNTAFADLAADLNTDVAGLLALTNLQDILLYHVLDGSVASAAIMNGMVVDAVSATNTLKLTLTSNSEVYVNHAIVELADVPADNGVVHAIDAVVLPNETVADVAIDNGFSTLVTAVATAELLPAITDPFAELTVFAPDNAAFDDLAAELNTDIAGLLALPNLQDILLYHVLDGEVDAASIANGDVVDALSTTNTLKLTKTGDGDVFVNQAEVVLADVGAENGIVHALDAVVLPNETVVDVALNNGFTTLATAVVTAELLPALTDPFAEYTVFAPDNDAFADLAAALDTDLAGVLALDNLAQVLLYHVVDGRVLSSALANGQVTTLSGSDVTVNIDNGVMINSSTVTAADIETDNGVVHAIDAVLLDIPTGINDVTIEALSFYPNPVQDMIRVENLSNTATYQVFAIDGTLVSSGVVNGSTIDVSNLQSGSYMISVEDENTFSQGTVIKL